MSSGSPLVDVGDPALTDADGSASDIGAFGGPDGANWDMDGDGWATEDGDCNASLVQNVEEAHGQWRVTRGVEGERDAGAGVRAPANEPSRA